MSIEQSLVARSNEQCELCTASDSLAVFEVPASPELNAGTCIYICNNCNTQITGNNLQANHWRCLNDAMWSQTPAIQVMSYRLLKQLDSESWAQDALDMLYLEDDIRKWAEAGLVDLNKEPTLDVNGAQLNAGDNVTLVKDLNVKGGNFTAKQGTMVRGISLSDNPKHIEGKVSGQRIVIIAEYCKKA